MELWKCVPGLCEETPTITPYLPAEKKSDAAVVIFPGGGYEIRAPHEGKGYAEFLAAAGIAAFVVDYRVSPHRFPLPLLDARRAVRFVRAHAAEYGIDPHRVAVMGSSAGGHLAATCATYRGTFAEEQTDEIDREDCRPDAQILCYPVICAPSEIAHIGSWQNLLGGSDPALEQRIDPAQNVGEDTPPAFIWHTADDNCVHVANAYTYATALRAHNIPVEMHIFPHGPHGLGLATESLPYVSRWGDMLLCWFGYLGWL